MPKVYVVRALNQNGGAYMAYHLGRIIHKHFGYEFVHVKEFASEVPRLFTYDIEFETIPLNALYKHIKDTDILIANAAASHHLFSLNTKAKKIMYVQGITTFQVLDCGFDLYISASRLVQQFLASVYNINTDVIHPFIELQSFPKPISWEDRPPKSVFLYKKQNDLFIDNVTNRLINTIKMQIPDTNFISTQTGRVKSHKEFLNLLGSARVFINMSAVEGFGLVPLEAMGMKTLVTGLNGLAGDEFQTYGENSLTVSIKNLHELEEAVLHALTITDLNAAHITQNGYDTAQEFVYKNFEKKWIEVLSKLLSK